MRDLFGYVSKSKAERFRRRNVAIWSCAYEIFDHSLVPDHVFDAECRKINLDINTNRPDLDAWFKENFDPCTGIWIYDHPDLEKIKLEVKRKLSILSSNAASFALQSI